uniref:Uncharacterized protein n=1 Tax=Alexandrium andersonii TaxID=327968 RepID=A0A7S2D4U6_9DINO
MIVVGGAPSLASSEVYSLRELADSAYSSSSSSSEHSRLIETVADLAEGRMGCQAVTMQLPAPDGRYPLCTRTCVVVVGGENGEEDWEGNQAHVRQFSSGLIFDVEDNEWRPESALPPMMVPRTAMALCVGPGYIRGYPYLQRAGFRGGC